MPDLPLIARARSHGDRAAVAAPEGSFTYHELLATSELVAASLLDGRDDLREARAAFLVPAGWQYVVLQWGIWRAGGVAVPLAASHPPPELRYVIDDAEASIVIAHPELAEKLRPVLDGKQIRHLSSAQTLLGGRPGALPNLHCSRRAMMVYTSGTTGRPKGVVTTHANIAAQVSMLVGAWGWTPDDHILLVLPLHHVHGIVNVLTCALWSGALCEIMPSFDARAVLDRFAAGGLSLFMAVPTIYRRLISAWDAADPARQRAISAGCRRMRLMVSGSAALPVSTLERWQDISGHVLLERYGMTEIGMALSNPLHGDRRPGTVGTPLPGVELRLVDSGGRIVTDEGTPGEIQVRGPGVFLEYWQRPEATQQAFTEGWFRTGDMAVVEDGRYRILGRSSTDIIKTGGYKVSALEIEEALHAHPSIAECAVVGVADPEWGERMCAAVELRPGRTLQLDELKQWARDRLAPYKVPRDLVCVAALPRNTLGKVMKPEVVRLFVGR